MIWLDLQLHKPSLQWTGEVGAMVQLAWGIARSEAGALEREDHRGADLLVTVRRILA